MKPDTWLTHQDDRSALGGGPVLLSGEALKYARSAKAKSTLRAYRSDWNDFASWCAERSCTPLPADPATVAEYLTLCARRLRPSTLQRRLAAIALAHDSAGAISPTHHAAVKEVMAGIRRTHGNASTPKRALRLEEVFALTDSCGPDLAGLRDRALILIGFVGAFRRSELVSLDLDDISEVPEGLVLTLRRSKTDQEGVGRTIAVPHGVTTYDPVGALRHWLVEAGIDDGPVFRPVTRHGTVRNRRLTAQSVALVLKRSAVASGIDPREIAGHSLRSGFATSAARSGADERRIMDQTGHKSLDMVRRYIREGDMFNEHAAHTLGL